MAPSAHSTPNSPRLQRPVFEHVGAFAYTARASDGELYGEATLREHSTRRDGAYELRVYKGRLHARMGKMGPRQLERATRLAELALAELERCASAAGWERRTVQFIGRPVELWYAPQGAPDEPQAPQAPQGAPDEPQAPQGAPDEPQAPADEAYHPGEQDDGAWLADAWNAHPPRRWIVELPPELQTPAPVPAPASLLPWQTPTAS